MELGEAIKVEGESKVYAIGTPLYLILVIQVDEAESNEGKRNRGLAQKTSLGASSIARADLIG